MEDPENATDRVVRFGCAPKLAKHEIDIPQKPPVAESPRIPPPAQSRSRRSPLKVPRSPLIP